MQVSQEALDVASVLDQNIVVSASPGRAAALPYQLRNSPALVLARDTRAARAAPVRQSAVPSTYLPRRDAGRDVDGHPLGVEVDQRPGWHSWAIVDELARASDCAGWSFKLPGTVIVTRSREVRPSAHQARWPDQSHTLQYAWRELWRCLGLGARCAAPNHQARRSVASQRPLLIEEYPLRHDRVLTGLPYQRNLWTHGSTRDTLWSS